MHGLAPKNDQTRGFFPVTGVPSDDLTVALGGGFLLVTILDDGGSPSSKREVLSTEEESKEGANGLVTAGQLEVTMVAWVAVEFLIGNFLGTRRLPMDKVIERQ